MSRTSSPGIYSRSSSKSIPRPLKWLKYAPTIVSFTKRLVRTSTRRTDSRSSERVMGLKGEIRRPKVEGRKKAEGLKSEGRYERLNNRETPRRDRMCSGLIAYATFSED